MKPNHKARINYEDDEYFKQEHYGKKHYDTKKAAKKAIQRMLHGNFYNKSKLKTRRLSAYKCSFCGLYHIGHSKKNA